MEATLNPLLSTSKQVQSGLSAATSDLFSIDSGNLMKNQSTEDSFSDLLQEKIDKKRSAKREERNNLPLGGKEESIQPERNRKSELNKEDSVVKQAENSREGETEKQRSAEQAGHSKEQSEQTASDAEPNAADGAEDGSDVTAEGLVSDQILVAEDGEASETDNPEAMLNALQQPVSGNQQETVAVVSPQAAANQQHNVTEEAVELDEALMEEEMVKRASAEQGRGRSPNLPPELQKGDQQIHLNEEMNLKSAMNALKEQHAAGAMASGQGTGGEQTSQNGGNQSMNSLFSAADPVNSAERPVQLKGMTVTPQSRQWSSELGERILFMAGKKIQSAEIRLNPPNLGLMEVKLAISGEQAQLVFQSGNANVRDVLESAVPRIREMLEQNGITLTDVTVSDGKQQQESAESGEGEQRRGDGSLGGLGEGVDEEVVPISSMAVDRIGLVDYYI